MVPGIIKDWNLRIDGLGFAGVTENLTLPNLEHKMEEFQGLGMLGPVKLDMGLNGFEIEFELKEWNTYVTGQLGQCDVSGIRASLIGVSQTQDANCTTQQHQLICHGRWESHNYGEAKQSEMATLKVKMPLTRFEHLVDGVHVVLIDLLNPNETTGGINRHAEIAQKLEL